MAVEQLDNALVEEIFIFNEMPPNVIKQETDTWTPHMWDIARKASEYSELTRKTTAATIAPILNDFEGVVDEEEMANLKHLELCINMPLETLEKVLSLAPQEQLITE